MVYPLADPPARFGFDDRLLAKIPQRHAVDPRRHAAETMRPASPCSAKRENLLQYNNWEAFATFDKSIDRAKPFERGQEQREATLDILSRAASKRAAPSLIA
jgi:hypothetical protein